jgi:hypothetical protein
VGVARGRVRLGYVRDLSDRPRVVRVYSVYEAKVSGLVDKDALRLVG